MAPDEQTTGTPDPAPSTPPPAGSSGGDENMMGMLCWLLGIFIWILSPIIFILVGKDKPRVYANAMQCTAFQIVMIILWVLVTILTFVTCGVGVILFIIPYGLNVVFGILGAIEANKGNVYEPPVTGGLAKSWFKV